MPVNSPHTQYTLHAPQWKRCRDVMCGQDAMHKAGEEYLPMLKDQEPDDYKAYVARATFYNATWRTIAGLTGMILSKQPHVEVPAAVMPLLDDVNASGTPLTLFLKQVCDEVLGLGRVGILVDYPSVSLEGLTLADARRLSLQPMLQLYRAEAILNWRCEKVGAAYQLTQVVLEEQVETAVDEYEKKAVKQYRVLDLFGGRYRVRVFQQGEGGTFAQVGGDAFPLMNGQSLTYIPFVPIGPDGTTMDADDPPLIDLVNLNVSHYKTTADLEHAAHFVGLPTPVISGYRPETPGEKIRIGSATAIVLPEATAKATYLEFSGQGLEALEKRCAAKEQQMAVVGARMLEPQTKAKESPEGQSIRRKGEESMLASLAVVIGLGMTVALEWFTEWAGADSAEVSCELNQDFYPVSITPQMLLALVQSWQAGAISDQVLFENLQAGEIVSEETTLEEEQARREESQVPPAPEGYVPPGQQPPVPTEGA